MKVGVDAAVVPVDDIQQVLEVGRLYSLQIAEGRQEAVISSGGLFLGQKLADEVLDYFISTPKAVRIKIAPKPVRSFPAVQWKSTLSLSFSLARRTSNRCW